MSKIKPYIIDAIFSKKTLSIKRAYSEYKRKKANQPHKVTVYLRINDAYSYVLIQVLAELQKRFSIEYDFRTVLNLQPEMYPAPNLWAENGFSDAQHLAKLYDLNCPSEAPIYTEQENKQFTSQLLHWELQPNYLEHALGLFHGYWQQNQAALKQQLQSSVVTSTECYAHHLLANEALLKQSGHYLSAMLHYGNEFYWGLNRLQYLEQRLNALNLQSGTKQICFNKSQIQFCKGLSQQDTASKLTQDNTQPIILFWSLRSPYSYLGLLQAIKLSKHYRTPLIIKPVLPMLMRRMQVPKAKSWYIATDVKRESITLGISFGRIADPLGAGVERCYAVYEYANSLGKGLALLESFATGVWSEGIDAATDGGVKIMIERIGLSWNEVQPLLGKNDWRVWAQDNLAELYGNKLWGVPSFLYGEEKVFGQDRIDRIEQAICDDLMSR